MNFIITVQLIGSAIFKYRDNRATVCVNIAGGIDLHKCGCCCWAVGGGGGVGVAFATPLISEFQSYQSVRVVLQLSSRYDDDDSLNQSASDARALGFFGPLTHSHPLSCRASHSGMLILDHDSDHGIGSKVPISNAKCPDRCHFHVSSRSHASTRRHSISITSSHTPAGPETGQDLGPGTGA